MKKRYFLLALAAVFSCVAMSCGADETEIEVQEEPQAEAERGDVDTGNEEVIDEAADDEEDITIEIIEGTDQTDEYDSRFEHGERIGTTFINAGDAEASEFETWQEGYEALIENLASSNSSIQFSLVYVNDDDIPELAYTLDDGTVAIASFAGPTVDIFSSQITSMSYIEQENSLFACEFVGATYGDYVLAIDEGGFWIQLVYGTRGPIDEWAEDSFDENGEPIISRWVINDEDISNQEEYDGRLLKYFDTSAAKAIDNTLSSDEALSEIDNM